MRDASKAAQSASSFHMAGSVRVPSGALGANAITLDLSLARGKGATGSVTVGGSKVDLVVTGKTGYMRASSAFWKKFATQQGGGAAAGFAASLFADKWLKFPADNQQFGALTSPTRANGIFKSLTSNHGKLANEGEETYKGQSVVVIHDTTKGGTLYVAATGTPIRSRSPRPVGRTAGRSRSTAGTSRSR